MNAATVINADTWQQNYQKTNAFTTCHMFTSGKDFDPEAPDLKEQYNWELCR